MKKLKKIQTERVFSKTFFKQNMMRQNCALDRSTILYVYVPGFQRQIFEHFKFLSERSKGLKEQKKTKGASLLRNPLTIHEIHSLAS